MNGQFWQGRSPYIVLVSMTISNMILTNRNERLESLLEDYRRRESEEASSLEQSMSQIEMNLKMATVPELKQLITKRLFKLIPLFD